MKASPRIGSLIAALFVDAVCFAGVHYTGDGRLIDHGKHRLTNRYEVILGTIKLGGLEEQEFRMAGLPHREFILGIRLNTADCGLKRSPAMVSLTVVNERGETVIHEERALRELTWQTTLGRECQSPFGYVRGNTEAASGAKECVRTVIADQGRGTYFVSRETGRYQVRAIVRQGDKGNAGDAALLVVLQDNGAPPPEHKQCP